MGIVVQYTNYNPSYMGRHSLSTPPSGIFMAQSKAYAALMKEKSTVIRLTTFPLFGTSSCPGHGQSGTKH